jgi:hypothetical protein
MRARRFVQRARRFMQIHSVMQSVLRKNVLDTAHKALD